MGRSPLIGRHGADRKGRNGKLRGFAGEPGRNRSATLAGGSAEPPLQLLLVEVQFGCADPQARCEEFTRGPDVVGQAGGHEGGGWLTVSLVVLDHLDVEQVVRGDQPGVRGSSWSWLPRRLDQVAVDLEQGICVLG